MILIGDGGATKADWGVITKKKAVKYFETMGFNPFFVSTEQIHNILLKDLIPFVNEKEIKMVFFYGAGCINDEKRVAIQQAMEEVFSGVDYYIESDLLGAARALFGNEPGIACILGTGSNSCLFNGKDIVKNVASLGYILGDEGSGANIGKMLLKNFLRGWFPADLNEAFLKKYNLTYAEALNKVYRQPFPNIFIGQFTKFAADYKNHEYIRPLLIQSFDDFFTHHILHYEECKQLPIRFVGSIAHFFEDILAEVAAKKSLKVDKIIKNPIQALIEYHLPTIDLDKLIESY